MRVSLFAGICLAVLMMVACGEYPPPDSFQDVPVDGGTSALNRASVESDSADLLDIVRAKDVIERSPSECSEKHPALPLRVLSAENPEARELLASHPQALVWKRGDRLDGLIIPPDNPLRSPRWKQLLSEHLPPDKRGVPLAEIMPYAPSCDGDNEGVTEDECLDISRRQEMADESREAVKNLLLASYYDIVDEYPSLFGVSAEALSAQKLNVVFRRTYRDFELEIERRAYTFPCENSETLVSFNLDGSLFAISRGPITASEHEALQQGEGNLGLRSLSESIALAHIRGKHPDAPIIRVARSSRGYCPNRGLVVDSIIIATGNSPDRFESVQVSAESGEVIASSPVSSYSYSDAKVKRTSHQSGSHESSYTSTVVTGNLYTRHASKLQHDFFYVMDANRCIDGSLFTCPTCPTGAPRCSDYPFPVNHCRDAFLPTGSARIRSAVRSDRDFSVFTGHQSIEGHTYYWARNYMQWQKEALNRLALLPPSSTDYTRSVIVVNACVESAFYTDGGFTIRTENDYGEGLGGILLRNADPAICYPMKYSFLGNVCTTSPPEIAHELNHFVMFRYLGVTTAASSCGSGNENDAFNELLGLVLPHARWHTLFSVGYSPSDPYRLYNSNNEYGKVHYFGSGLMTRTTHPCGSGGSYHSGRVLGQALWKTYFGNDYKRIHLGGGLYTWIHVPIESYSSTTDFIEALYRAAKSAKGGSLELYALYLYIQATYRFSILETTSQKCGWCQMFERHGLMSCNC